jgi:cephalosporin hydroxylase
MNSNLFENRNKRKIDLMANDKKLSRTSKKWFLQSYGYEYSYHFRWLGRPIIQYPQDIIAIQEIIWNVKPDLIIETGIAHGGSLIFSASMLELIGKGMVLGIDIDIRKHNKKEIENHFLYKRIKMIEGSSVDENVSRTVYKFAKDKRKIMVILDSNHTHEHVLKEMQLYSPLVTRGSYMIVFDTVIDDIPKSFFKNKPWSKNNNPKSAIKEFLKNSYRFKIDKAIENKLLITAAPSGFLKRVR